MTNVVTPDAGQVAGRRGTGRGMGVCALVLCGMLAGGASASAEGPKVRIHEIGPAMPSVNVRSSDFGYLPDGTPVAFATSNGEPVTFNVLDLRTGESLHSEAVHGEMVSGSVHQSADGSVYFNVTQASPGALYRYLPQQRQLTKIGERINGQVWLRHITSGKGGTLYMSTYPDAKLLAYDPSTGKIRDYGSVADDATYAYTVEIVGDELWLGTGPVPHLVAVHRDTGEMREIEIPARLMEKADYITHIDKRGDRVFIHLTRGVFDTLMHDLRTGEWSDMPLRITSAGMTEADSNGNVYFMSGRDLYRYDLESGAIEETNIRQTGAASALQGSQRVYDIGMVEIDGRTAIVGMTTTGNLWRYFPDEGTGDVLKGQVQPSAAKIVGFGVGPDGKIYTGAKIGVGTIGRLDPATREIETLSGPSQAEGVGGKGNIIVIGDYSGAGLNIGDLSQPWSWGRNPKQIHRFGRGGPYHQDRIWTVEAAGDRIALGTIPEPGQNGGALILVDPDTGDYELHRDVVEHQSVVELTARDGLLYGATSIHGGSGTPNEATEACLFIWDLETDRKVWEGVPVAGASIINGLTWTPDGHLWGIAESGEVFEFDPQSREVLQVERIAPQRGIHPWGNNSSLAYDPQTDGFWATVGKRMYHLDRQTLAVTPYEHEQEILRLVRLDSGDLYAISETHLYFIEPVAD